MFFVILYDREVKKCWFVISMVRSIQSVSHQSVCRIDPINKIGDVGSHLKGQFAGIV